MILNFNGKIVKCEYNPELERIAYEAECQRTKDEQCAYEEYIEERYGE